MEKSVLKLSIDINAPKEKVWEVLLDDKTYRIWTSVFHPGSYAETDDNWREGSKVYFKTPEGDGMISKVAKHEPGRIISFEHQGVLEDHKEVYNSPEIDKWKGLTETYSLTEHDQQVSLHIEQDITPEYADNFEVMWENALKKVKELSESR